VHLEELRYLEEEAGTQSSKTRAISATSVKKATVRPLVWALLIAS
jgi:hypothetical protein